MPLAPFFVLLVAFAPLALANLPAQTPIVAPAPTAPTASVAQYTGITVIPQVAIGPSPWSPPPGYPGATVAGTTVGSNGQTTLSWKDTHRTWINIPSSPPTSPPCGTWTVASTSATFNLGSQSIIFTEPVLTASTIPPITKWSTTTTTTTTTTTSISTSISTTTFVSTTTVTVAPPKVCIDTQASWEYIQADADESWVDLRPGGFDFDFPMKLTVVSVEYPNTKFDVLVDGNTIGHTSNYKHSVAQKDHCQIDNPQDCIKRGHSWGEFNIPKGHHNVLLFLDQRSRKDGYIKGLVYKIVCRW